MTMVAMRMVGLYPVPAPMNSTLPDCTRWW